jgi:hypothetical protein
MFAHSINRPNRFTDTEKWRKEFAGIGVDELVKTFDYKEKPKVFEYYPQYYHKTDKVRTCIFCSNFRVKREDKSLKVESGRATSLYRTTR